MAYTEIMTGPEHRAPGLEAATDEDFAPEGEKGTQPVNDDPGQRSIAESFGARAHSRESGDYDVVVEATSRPTGLRPALRALASGGVCTAVGYYLATGTRVPLMRMYATDATLRLGVSHSHALLPDLLDLFHRTGFPAERVTTLEAPWDEAPAAYTARTTKVVLRRDPLTPDTREAP
ncbi:hypothetical protein [Amycolatopsis sp. NPDC052450]|uniref:hypothetical protein n=1 Tax=Amycolatopsis sp. NPDC052450 TaxID=3363937 RepID=UPI0037C78D21